jgi:hypothetical protein
VSNAKFDVLWHMQLMVTFHVYCDIMPEIWTSAITEVLPRHPLLGNDLVNMFLWQQIHNNRVTARGSAIYAVHHKVT